MCTHADAHRAASGARLGMLVRSIAVVLTVAVAPVLAGCRDAPAPPVAGRNPADPAAPAPAVGYRSTIGSYTSQRPVDPAPWGEQNQRVAPRPKSDPKSEPKSEPKSGR
jgi:hypothetical protein